MSISKEKLQKQRETRLNSLTYNNQGYLMKIIEYNNANDITIEFQDEYKTKVKNKEYSKFLKGEINNPYHKTIYGMGYIGQGKYKTKENGKKTKPYSEWRSMLERAYNKKYKEKYTTYEDVEVCEEWHNYQNFAKWYEENYYEIPNEKMCLDKDILKKGNKIYSPKTCCFVPEKINNLFTKSDKARGEYPIGVCLFNNKLMVQCSMKDRDKRKNKFLGYYPLNKPFQAFYSYKVFKESYIKQIADEYKDLIPKELYDALYEYEVEIND